MMIKSLQIVVAFILATLALGAQPAIDDIAGTTYVVAYPEMTANRYDPRFPNPGYQDRALVVLYSAVDNRIRVTAPGYAWTGKVEAGRFATIDLTSTTAAPELPIVIGTNVVGETTFRVEADEPVVLYCYLLTRFGAEAWTPLPVESWGREYVVAARPGEIVRDISAGGETDYIATPKMAPAEITIVAAYDDTHVAIHPAGPLLGHPDTTDIVLQAGQAYQIRSHVDTSVVAKPQSDLGGSRISSTKPVGVISGNTRAQVQPYSGGLAQNIFKNMLFEWLAPLEQHGTEFVYLPTWDARRPDGAGGGDGNGVRRGEMVRIYATTPGPTHGLSLGGSSRRDFAIADRGTFHEEFISDAMPRYYRTDRPAQAMMNSTAVVRYNGTTTSYEGHVGTEYDGWGAYMVELVPRERWSSFAPYYAPGQPATMEHFIDVVTDSTHRFDVFMENGAPFLFERGTIAGTDLIWGTMKVTAMKDHSLTGRNGARFSGHLYGLYTGHEEHRPGGTTGGDEPDIAGAHSTGGDEGSVLHASEYEEHLAVAYGYPLPSRHLFTAAGSSIGIDSATDCGAMTLDLTALGNPFGLQSIRLDSAANAQVLSVTPDVVSGALSTRIVIAPISTARRASGVIVVRDRTGRIIRVPYQASMLQPECEWSPRDFSQELITVDSVVSAQLVITNRSDGAMGVSEIAITGGAGHFRIDSISRGALPVDLPPGENVVVFVSARADSADRKFDGSLRVVTDCLEKDLPMSFTMTDPEIALSDIDFGTLVGLGARSNETMYITNTGSGTLSFSDDAGGEIISLVHRQHFIVDSFDLARLRTTQLRHGETAAIRVGFHAVTEGTVIDSVTFSTNDRDRTVYSIWRATVRRVSGVEAPGAVETGVEISPNPATGAATFRFRLDHAATVRLVIVDADGREVAVVERALGAGEQSLAWDATSLPAGVYFYRLVTGAYTATGTAMVVR